MPVHSQVVGSVSKSNEARGHERIAPPDMVGVNPYGSICDFRGDSFVYEPEPVAQLGRVQPVVSGLPRRVRDIAAYLF